MRDFLHLLMCPFTGLGLHQGYRGDDWFKYRIGIFKQYPLRALLNQTEKDFVLWVCFREQERDNPLTKEFYNDLNKTGLKFIFTFGGIPIHDDKYQNDNLLERLKVILPQLKSVYNGEKYIYETCQPSDDFYHQKEVEEIQKQEYKDRRILTHSRGYVFNHQTQRLAEWNPVINPPFYTIMYPADVFFDAEKHFKYMRNSENHGDVVWIFDQLKMPNYRYCVLTHGKQISTTWFHPYREGMFNWNYSGHILKEFGIDIGTFSAIRYGIAEIREFLRYWIFRLFIKGRVYKVLKKIKNEYEHLTRNSK